MGLFRSIFRFLLLSYSFHAIRMDIFIFCNINRTRTGINGYVYDYDTHTHTCTFVERGVGEVLWRNIYLRIIYLTIFAYFSFSIFAFRTPSMDMFRLIHSFTKVQWIHTIIWLHWQWYLFLEIVFVTRIEWWRSKKIVQMFVVSYSLHDRWPKTKKKWLCSIFRAGENVTVTLESPTGDFVVVQF